MVKDLTVVSLSRGILGEDFIRHELEIGVKRLESYGIRVHFSANALKGLDYVKDHPEKRAEDLISAFESDTEMILCAVGGDDSYRLLPYLFENGQLEKAVKEKVFLGFSDTTMNHFMLHKVGLNTFYGQAFLPDICELSGDMLPYSKSFFLELIETGRIARIKPSKIWYDSREDFSPKAMGTGMPCHANSGFVLLQGAETFEGEILGGCLDTIYDIFNGDRYADSPEVCGKYGLFPSLDDWRGKILLLETSEEKATPDKFRSMVQALKKTGVFEVIHGLLLGKPADETHYDAYNRILQEVIGNPELPIVVNVNVGHATPRCIVPFGVPAKVNAAKQEIVFA